jgi:hypothetical protein
MMTQESVVRNKQIVDKILDFNLMHIKRELRSVDERKLMLLVAREKDEQFKTILFNQIKRWNVVYERNEDETAGMIIIVCNEILKELEAKR